MIKKSTSFTVYSCKWRFFNIVNCADDLSVSPGRFSLKNITLEIKEKEIYAILGQTGSGKSVLLESLAGFYEPSSGSVTSRPRAPYHMTVQTFAIYLLKTGISDSYIRIMDFFLI